MQQIQSQILTLFKQYETLSTADIVEYLNPTANYKRILADKYASSQEQDQAQAQKLQLHRQVLHHTNNLVKGGILILARREAHGQKVYKLNLLPNEELVIEGSSKKIVLQTKVFPFTPLEGYESTKQLFKFEAQTWIDRLNAILLESRFYTQIAEFESMILDALLHVNDVVGINDFELVIQQFELDALVSFLDDIHTQCLDYNRRVCFIIDASNIKQANTIKLFITKFVELQLPNISLVFDVTSRELMELHDLFCEIVKLYAQKNWKFNIKNDDVHRAPYIIGRAGPYTISPSDWAAYLSDEPTIGMSLTQATVVIDLAKYTNKAKEFEHMMQAVAKSLFIVDKTQHKDAEEYFRHLIKHRGFVSERFFTASTLSVRFLNTSHVAVDTALALLTQSKEFLSAFSYKQECIFGSCGMPIRCSIVQGLAYKHAVATFFTENERLDIAIGTDLYKPEFRKALNMHEEFAKILSGGYEVRINRTAIASPPDVLGECSLLMNTYVIPFFCYRFDIPSRQTKQLSTYLEQK